MIDIRIKPSYTEVNKNNFIYVDRMFGSTANNAWNMVENSTFPDGKKIKVNDLGLAKLLFLASFKNELEKCPFTEDQIRILRSSQRWSKATTWSLKIGLIFNTILFAGVSLSPLVTSTNGNVTDIQSNTTSGITATTAGVIVFVGLIGVLTNAISFWSTGFSPDYSSISSNKEQDVLAEIKETYINLSGRLIMLYFSKEGNEEALRIARNIDLEELSKKCFHFIQNKTQTRQIITPISEAVEFILSGETILPESIGLLNTIEIQKIIHH